MEYQTSTIQLSEKEVIAIYAGRNQAVYEVGDSFGYFVGSCIKDWLFCISF